MGYFAPNGYGLYDMIGNLCEWCWDRFGISYYGISPSSNPHGSVSGSDRVLRGGGWNYYAVSCRSASRYNYAPDYGNYAYGFRAVLSQGQ